MLGALALLRNPSELDGEGLGKAATAAAREGLDDAEWWKGLSARARALAPQLALHDATLVLNGMARARRLDKEFVSALLPRLTTHMVYLTSAHLAMVCSAVAKSEVHDAEFVNQLTRELKARLLEFHSPMELTMIINSVSKLRVSDEQLYARFMAHAQNRMAHETFHARDISVILVALARVSCADSGAVSRLADASLQTLPEATVPELARLMEACMRADCAADEFLTACVLHAREQILGMDPGGLSSAAFAFGQCFEVAGVAHLPYLRKVFRHIRVASVTSLPLFLPREIGSVLRTYARWQVGFEVSNLQRFADRMTATSDKFDVAGAVSALFSLSVLMQRSAARSTQATATTDAAWAACGEAAHALLGPVWRATRAGQMSWPMVLRAVDASVALLPGEASLTAALTAALVRRRGELDAPTCYALYERLLQHGVSPDEDVMVVFSEGMTASP